MPMVAISSSLIKDIILHPNMFNVSSGNESLELWNKGNTATTLNNNSVNKTIYSPSPQNYSEPKSAAYTGFTISNVSGSYNKGWNFYCQINNIGPTIFMAALGYRLYNSGGITNVGITGHYWSTGTSSGSYGHYVDFNSTRVIQYDSFRSHGLFLRPAYE